MELDEAGTAQAVREYHTAADPLIAQHGGRVVKTTGDGVLIEFGSVVGAVQCAIGLHKLAAERNAGSPATAAWTGALASISATYWSRETTF